MLHLHVSYLLVWHGALKGGITRPVDNLVKKLHAPVALIPRRGYFALTADQWPWLRSAKTGAV
jgi:hypothetical protein